MYLSVRGCASIALVACDLVACCALRVCLSFAWFCGPFRCRLSFRFLSSPLLASRAHPRAQIKKGQFSFPDPYWTDISTGAKDLVRGLLTVDPKKRLSAKDMLKHPWITSGTANTKSLGADYAARIKTMQAKRKLRRTVQIILAVNKFSELFQALIEDANVQPTHKRAQAPAAGAGAGAAAGTERKN